METISMSRKERRRLEVFSRVKSGDVTVVQASEWLGLSYRQAKRIWSRFQQDGDVGLAHRLRGQASNRKSDTDLKERVMALYREQYCDYGPTLAAECLAQEDGVKVSVTTIRRWLLQSGLLERRRKRRAHRLRRARREHRGELLQMDGSYHDWFEGRCGWAVLMVMIDDATGTVDARFYENESWFSATDMFQRYVIGHGLPRGLYVDQHSIYRADREPTGDELIADFEPETQFGRAMRELAVELILAHSPQAKGRVERMNGTLQDRLVKALRRAKIVDLESANQFLVDSFLPEFNQRFSVSPHAAKDWHCPLPADTDLPRILSIQERRVVQNDWTVRWNNQVLQLPREMAEFVQPKQQVTVCEQLNGILRVFVSDHELNWHPTRSEPPRRKPTVPRPIASNQGQKPRADHPWRGKHKPRTADLPGGPGPAAPELACSATAR